MNNERQVFENGDLLIEDDKIVEVGFVSENRIEKNAHIIDATDRIVMPGLINTHVHLSQQLGRGIADDVDLLTWLHDRIWPYESNMTQDESYISSLACCLELIHSGVTTFLEPGGQEVDGMAKAVAEIGIRGVLARSTMDCGEGLPKKWQESTEMALEVQEALISKYNNTAEGRIRVWFGLRTIFNNSDGLILRTKELADKYGVGIHMHVAEIPEELAYARLRSGYPTVEHLGKLGVLDSNLLAVHTVWMTSKEIDLFRLHNVKVSHNPAAAMKILGFAAVPEMLEKGIPVSIGTDGAPSNNRMDMLDEMHLAALIHKGRTLNTKIVPAEQILEMATINGAKSALWEDEIGSLEPGKKADLIIINPKSPGSYPIHDAISNLVYSMHSSNVEASMVNGNWIMRDKKILNINEDELLTEINKRAKELVKRSGIVLPNRFPTIKVR